MSTKFWIKRAVSVLAISFSVIFVAQYFKSNNLFYALGQATLWGAVSSAIYLLVLWNKLRKNPSCAINSQEEKK